MQSSPGYGGIRPRLRPTFQPRSHPRGSAPTHLEPFWLRTYPFGAILSYSKAHLRARLVTPRGPAPKALPCLRRLPVPLRRWRLGLERWRPRSRHQRWVSRQTHAPQDGPRGFLFRHQRDRSQPPSTGTGENILAIHSSQQGGPIDAPGCGEPGADGIVFRHAVLGGVARRPSQDRYRSLRNRRAARRRGTWESPLPPSGGCTLTGTRLLGA
jgi:hypothetical protein